MDARFAAKFLGGDYAEKGVTQRRHVFVEGVEYIGKEADRWEEQVALGAAGARPGLATPGIQGLQLFWLSVRSLEASRVTPEQVGEL
jgi:hypothetical protein